jgi:hypothetical protein
MSEYVITVSHRPKPCHLALARIQDGLREHRHRREVDTSPSTRSTDNGMSKAAVRYVRKRSISPLVEGSEQTGFDWAELMRFALKKALKAVFKENDKRTWAKMVAFTMRQK